MKKKIFLLLVIPLLTALTLIAQERKEMVVLFDTSVSVLPIYEDLTNLVLQGTLENQIRRGDSFHLLSFAERPVYEFSQDIREEKSRGRIRNYMEVLKPMGLHTDLIRALNFLYGFVQDLSINTRKTILILTDGIHDPPPGAPSYGKTQAYVEQSLREITAKINRQGWDVRILQLDARGELSEQKTLGSREQGNLTDSDTDGPEDISSAGNSEGSSPEENNFLNLVSEGLKAPVTPFDQREDQEDLANRVMGVTRLVFPEEIGKVGRSFSFPMEVANYGDLTTVVNLQGIHWGGINILKKDLAEEIPPGERKTLGAEIRLPTDMAPGSHSLELEFLFGEGQEVLPTTGVVTLTLGASISSGMDPLVFYAGGAFLLLVMIILATVLIRRLVERTARQEKNQTRDKRDGEVSSPESPGDGRPQGSSPSPMGKVVPPGSSAKAVESRRASSSKTPPVLPAKPPTPLKEVRKKAPKEDWEIVKADGGPSIEHWETHGAIEMKVEGQNPYLGPGNIRILKENTSLLVGGKGTPYHIFLHPVPPRVAEISYDGKDYTLTPLVSGAFPGLSGPLKGCLDKWIPLKASNEKTLRIKFIHWASPLERLNWLMHIIDQPGIPKKWY